MFAKATQGLIDDFILWKFQRNQDSEAEGFKSQLKRFVQYMTVHKEWITSVGDLTRKDIEDYITHLRNVEYDSLGQKPNRSSFVYRNLRALNKFLEYLTINEDAIDSHYLPRMDLICKADFPSPNQRGVKHFPVWLDKLILKEIKDLPEDTDGKLKFKTMAFIIYYVGARIKDVCTIEMDCIIKKLGYNWLRILSNKTKRYYEVPINSEVYKYLGQYIGTRKNVMELEHPTTRRLAKFLFVTRGKPDSLG